MNDTKEVAEEIAKRFGEEGVRPRRQLQRIVELMTPAWLTGIAETAERMLLDGDPISKRADGSARSRGGVLFAVARRAAFELVKKGELGRRDFFRTFCWREPQPKKVKVRAVVPVQAKPATRPKPGTRPGGVGPRPGGAAPRSGPTPRGGRMPEAEVYTVVRRVRT